MAAQGGAVGGRDVRGSCLSIGPVDVPGAGEGRCTGTRHLRQLVIAACVVPAALVTSCGSDEDNRWRDADSPTDAVREINGDDEHCDFGSITYIQLDDQREAAYVRDPEGIVSDYEGFEGRTQDLDAELPDDSMPTPYRRGDGTELWRSADGDYIFLVRDDVVERLPLSDPGPSCA